MINRTITYIIEIATKKCVVDTCYTRYYYFLKLE